jgi:mono/diheme cytochrome c family protein
MMLTHETDGGVSFLPRRGVVLIWTGWLAVTGGIAATASVVQKTTAEGVYTAAQADRGETVFGSVCVSCHSPSEFTEEEFLKKWNGQPLFELFDTVRGTMPMDNPGTLKPDEYADVVAYLLELNKFPAGAEELTTSEEALKAVTIERKGP